MEKNRKDNDFSRWMALLGYNKQQVTIAGALIGLGPRLSSDLSRGARQLTDTERLAAAAVVAGLPAWTPETHERIQAVGAVIKLLKELSLMPQVATL